MFSNLPQLSDLMVFLEHSCVSFVFCGELFFLFHFISGIPAWRSLLTLLNS